MPAESWLPATPAIRRLTVAFLGFDPWQPAQAGWHEWRERRSGKRTLLGKHDLLPLHVPAGLAVALLRLDELAPNHAQQLVRDPERVAFVLRQLDPELRAAGGSDV
jgi:hypothetical protein